MLLGDKPDTAYLSAAIVGAYLDSLKKLYPGFEFYDGGESDWAGVDVGTRDMFAAAQEFLDKILPRDMDLPGNVERVARVNAAIDIKRWRRRQPLLQVVANKGSSDG